MANNHQGSVKHGIRIIEAVGSIVKKYKIRAGIKFQYRDLDTIIHPDFKECSDVLHIPRFISTRLKDDEFLILIKAVKDQGMLSICTPFDEPSVHKCVEHGIEILKVASCSSTDWPLLESVAKTNKPVIISTGGILINEIDNIVSFFTHRNIRFSLMHCVAIYPTPIDMFNLNFIGRMIKRYPGVPIGYSGHENPDNFDVVKIAISKGASILERHIGIPTDTIKLNLYSMTPEQAEVWIVSALTAKQICSDNFDKQISQEELKSLLSLKRGVYAKTKIEKGDVIEYKNIFFAIPCAEGQTHAGEFGQCRTTLIASKDYKCNEPICEHKQPNIIGIVRNIVHDAKGMICEAGVALGSDFELELSHHYGIEYFRQIGALIINLVNREYCKKLVVLLSGQKHPNHFHKTKEETFQLLWGDLEVNLNGIVVKMKPGDKVLVTRGTWHSFNSNEGAIFEEISTTHIKGDSYYEDKQIQTLDPMERKTIIEEF